MNYDINRFCSSTSCTGWVGQAANAPQNSRITVTFLVTISCHKPAAEHTAEHTCGTHTHTHPRGWHYRETSCSLVFSSGHFSADCFSAAAGFSRILWMDSDPRLHLMSERGAVPSYQSGRPNKSFKTLQLVQNAALLTGTRQIDHVGSPVLASQDWPWQIWSRFENPPHI